MPTLKKNEKKDEFIQRCITDIMDKGDTDDPKQAYAICRSKYDQYQNKLLVRYIQTARNNNVS